MSSYKNVCVALGITNNVKQVVDGGLLSRQIGQPPAAAPVPGLISHHATARAAHPGPGYNEHNILEEKYH